MKPCIWKPTPIRLEREDGFVLESAGKEEAQLYLDGFHQIDLEAMKLTASGPGMEDHVVLVAYERFCEDPDRLFLVLKDPTGKIVGEAVINDLDREKSEANFRIALFTAETRGKGLGSWILQVICSQAFEGMRLERLTQDVLQTNPRARHVYEKAGFVWDSSCEEEIINQNGEKETAVFDFMVLDADAWKARIMK